MRDINILALDCCKVHAMAGWTYCYYHDQQQQEVEGYVQTIGDSRDFVLLGAFCGDLLSSYHGP